MHFWNIDSVNNTNEVTRVTVSPSDSLQNNKKIIIQFPKHDWMPSYIDPNDCKTTFGLGKYFPNGCTFEFEQISKDLIETNGAAGVVFINGQEIELDELIRYRSGVDNSYGSIGIKHTSEGDVIYIDRNIDGHTITTAKYVNGNLEYIEEGKGNQHSGIIPLA